MRIEPKSSHKIWSYKFPIYWLNMNTAALILNMQIWLHITCYLKFHSVLILHDFQIIENISKKTSTQLPAPESAKLNNASHFIQTWKLPVQQWHWNVDGIVVMLTPAEQQTQEIVSFNLNILQTFPQGELTRCLSSTKNLFCNIECWISSNVMIYWYVGNLLKYTWNLPETEPAKNDIKL
jgi:hypothetical protein